MKKQLDKDIVLGKLIRKGLTPSFGKNRILVSLTAKHANVHLGIKSLGYVDFLDTTVIKPEVRPRRNIVRRKNSGPVRGLAGAWHFKWFDNRESANVYVESQKLSPNVGFDVKVTNVYETEAKDFRVEIKGLEFPSSVQLI